MPTDDRRRRKPSIDCTDSSDSSSTQQTSWTTQRTTTTQTVRSSTRLGRLTVLESSIALIEQLTAACKGMDAACNANDAQVSRVSNQLHSAAADIAQHAMRASKTVATSSLDRKASAHGYPHSLSYHPYTYPSAYAPSSSYSPLAAVTHPSSSSSTVLSVLQPSTRSYLAHSDRSHTLRCGGLAAFSSLCVVVLVLPSTIVDVNDRFLASTGWRHSDLVHTTFEEYEDATVPLCPLAIDQQLFAETGNIRRLSQYPAALAECDTVRSGEKRKASSTWRSSMVDGRVFEFESTYWGEWDEPLVKGKQRPPNRMVFVHEMDDAVIVDDQ